MQFGKPILLLILTIATTCISDVQGKPQALSLQGQASFTRSTKEQHENLVVGSKSSSQLSKSTSGGTATVPNEIFNLIKSIVGAGVLSLPAGTSSTMHRMIGTQRGVQTCYILHISGFTYNRFGFLFLFGKYYTYPCRNCRIWKRT